MFRLNREQRLKSALAIEAMPTHRKSRAAVRLPRCYGLPGSCTIGSVTFEGHQALAQRQAPRTFRVNFHADVRFCIQAASLPLRDSNFSLT